MFKKIVVLVDTTEASLMAAMTAIELAKSLKAELHALYVVDTKSVSELFKAHIFVDQEKEEYEKELALDAKRYTDQVSRYAKQKFLDLITCIKSGSVVNETKTYLKQIEADLLVIGETAGIRSRREVMISDTDRFLHTSICPVLVVKDDSNIWQHFEEI